MAPGKQKVDHVDESELLERYYSALRVKLEHARGGTGTDQVLERVEALLSGSELAWSRAYEAEELLAEVWDENMLNIEIKRGLNQGERYLQPSTHELYALAAGGMKAGNVRGKRALFRGLLSDLHWRKTLFQLGRKYMRAYRARVGILCLAFLVLVLGALASRAYYLGGGFNKDVLDRIQGHLDIFYLLYASLVGIWGATFSMLTGAKRKAAELNFDAAKNLYSWSSILSRIAIGAGGGLLMYFFMKAGLLSGDLMPDFAVAPEMKELVEKFIAAAKAKDTPLMVLRDARLDLSNAITMRDVSVLPLLTVWTFIAGFSEKLVPGLLERTQSRIPSMGSDGSAAAVSTNTTPAEPTQAASSEPQTPTDKQNG